MSDFDARVGRNVYFKRDPFNKYDSTAVVAMNESGDQIGYLSRTVAAHLRDGLDRNFFSLYGVLNRATWWWCWWLKPSFVSHFIIFSALKLKFTTLR